MEPGEKSLAVSKMDKAVEKYRKRRYNRLKARFDADIEWITTESGLHIPLKGGVAASGPLKGKAFKSAKSTGSGKKMGERRKQIEAKGGKVKDADLEAFNKKAFKSIEEETGYSREDAKVFHDALLDYMGGDYHAYGKGKKEGFEKTIDDGLARMGAYDGETYRGLQFSGTNMDANKAFWKFEDMEVGDKIPARSVTSWSSDRGVAEGFASTGLAAGNSVVMICRNNKTGVGVQHISKFRDNEAEVLTPSTTSWRVVGKRVVSQYDLAAQKIAEMEKRDDLDGWDREMLADMKTNLRQRRRELMAYRTVFLEVEEA